VQSLKILHLEDDALDAELLLRALIEAGIACDIDRVATEGAFCSALDRGGFDLIVSDFSLPGFDGKAALDIARKSAPDIPFIFVSGTIGEDAAVDSLRAGATDYVLKHQFSKLIPAIRRAQRETEQRRERKRVEAQLFRTQRMHSIGTLAGGIAHDLNNVLAPILMAVQVLKEKNSDASSLRILDTLEQSAIRGANIVRQVLTFAKGLEGEQSPIQPKYVLTNMEKMLRETFPKSIRLQADIPKNLWTIVGDPTQLDQLLLNLCVNARDAMPAGGELRIRAENIVLDEGCSRIHIDAKPGPHVLFEIADTGTGIPQTIIDKIFEPFFTTKESSKGTGIGLSTVMAIVKSHRGFINVHSQVDGAASGTTFRVFVPAKESLQSRETSERLTGLPLGHGEMILIVDDELAVRDIAQVTLESYGYRVARAVDGNDAIARYAWHNAEIEAVLLDMMMPVMDGPATINALRKINPNVRIIAVSGLMERSLNVREEDAQSIRAILTKPYTAQKLLTTIHDVVAKPVVKMSRG
jgi:signal transduction histidine kinase